MKEKTVALTDDRETPETDLVIKKRAIVEEIDDRWKTLLREKIDRWLMDKIDEWREKFVAELYERIEQLEEMAAILDPFNRELGRLWDLSQGNWATTGFEILKHYAELISNEPAIQELAEYLGRMQIAYDEVTQEIIQTTEIVPIVKIERAAKEELVGIHESDDISHLLPSEVSLLGDKTTETLFYMKLAEKKLLTYDFHGYSYGSKEVGKQETVDTPIGSDDKGPIIICVDTSGSMHGAPENIAKTLSFAILRVALLQQRKCYLISFSTGIKTLVLTDFKQNYSLLIEFLNYSFHGGTDASPALVESLKMLQTKNYAKADVLMISDFVMPTLPDNIIQDIKNQQEHKTEFHSLVISKSANSKVLEIFDNNWLYHIGSPEPFKDIIHNLRNIRKTNPNTEFSHA
ncbi:MAG: VWA domain-containing protein [Candidatus Heimdallarchaeota archaeon]|nr:VWA domain-containing protein [Candidatus Heimdallarchaeota archaeon]